MKLNKSRVVFSETPHGYTLDGKLLSGITTLIRQVKGLGIYPEASDYVKNYCIPRAGDYGTAVHHCIEAFEALGIADTEQPKSERFRESASDTIWEVSRELESYIRHRKGFECIACEYTVSDNERYASNIDNVWVNEQTQGIWLLDTKTNNLDYYPGGVAKLQEYLSWQLSIYAYLFEQQNPALKVEGLACNWLRHERAEFWKIDRKPDEDVKALLSVEWNEFEGRIIIDIHDAQQKGVYYKQTAEVATRPIELPGITEQVIDYICTIEQKANEYKALCDETRATLREAMESAGVKAFECEKFKATIANGSVSQKFDVTRFKKDHPDLYKFYCVEQERKGGFTIKLK